MVYNIYGDYMRFNPDINIGLTSKQVESRIEEQLDNKDMNVKTKSISNIIFDNFFTLFNLVNIILGVAVMFVGSYKNLLFLGVVICNVLISTIQAIRSKLIVDKLSVLSNNKVTVIRDSKLDNIEVEDLVLDDIIVLKNGNQIPCDCYIKEGSVIVDESYITGESDSISYTEGDLLKSGSFIISGHCKALIEHVRLDNYISIISKEAKYIKPINSILLITIKKIIKYISIIIFPVGILLFYNQYQLYGGVDAILNTVAALIGMLPGGLVLLTSTVLAISVIRLGKLNVLVRDLYCIEMLARVDVICFDKTGTLTDGNLNLVDVVLLNEANVEEIMGNYVNTLGVENNTIKAICKSYKERANYKVISKKSFNSTDKYSSVEFKEGTFKLGAPEVLYKKIKEIEDIQREYRVVLLTKNDKPICYFVLEDNIKKSAHEMFNYFNEQDVLVKIISGDSVNTVSTIAKKVGIEVNSIDLTSIEVTEKIVLENNVFGRVNPEQKKQIIEILQKNKHFVAMAGDGVNDVLALKQADCSITIKDGTDMAKNVSQLVLLDSEYDSIYDIIVEGRRTVNNIERSATLFLSKNISIMLLSIIFIFINYSYPFLPIHLSLTNFFTIGVPSLLLALEYNNKKIKGNFLINILNKSLPTALVVIFNIVMILIVGDKFSFSSEEISTLSVILLGYTGFLLLFKLCLPFDSKRIGLFTFLLIFFLITVIIFRRFFVLTLFSLNMIIISISLMIISTIIFKCLINIFSKYIKEKM